MSSRMRTSITITLSAVLTMVAGISGQQEQQQRIELLGYTVTDLGTFGTAFASAQGISNKGWVDGVFGNQNEHEFVLRRGVFTDLGTLGGPNSGVGSFGQTPNELAQIVGAAESSGIDPLAESFCSFLMSSPPTNNVCLPFLWQNGVMTALPTLGGTNGGASEINNQGQIVGVAETTTLDPTCNSSHLNFEPVIWKNAEIHQLPTIGGDPDGTVDAINDIGQAVGATGNCSFGLHAALWQDGMVTDLGNLGGTFFFEATAINNQSQVVGFSDLPGDATFHAFIWQGGRMDDLGTLPGDFASFASSINNSSHVVGTSCAVNFVSCRGFLWENNAMRDLNTLIPAASPLYLWQAIGINDAGQIVGFAIQNNTGEIHAYLATPCGQSGKEACGNRVESNRIAAPPPKLDHELLLRLLPRGLRPVRNMSIEQP